jgi:voltage-gated sodium channel
VRSRPSAPNVFARIAAGKWFAAAVVVVILVNAVVLGLETYSRLNARYGHVLDLVNDVCLGLFVIELAIRIASFGRRPQDFFRSGWNVFDFVVILAGFTPGLGRDTTILRLVRLARVLRVVTVMPDLRILVVAVGAACRRSRASGSWSCCWSTSTASWAGCSSTSRYRAAGTTSAPQCSTCS